MTSSAGQKGSAPPAVPADFDLLAAAATALRAARPLRNPKLRDAAELLRQKQPEECERLLTKFLEKHPEDATAIHLMAKTVLNRGQREKAEKLFAQSLAIAPDFAGARFDYANSLLQQNKPADALLQLDDFLARDPANALGLDLKAVVLSAMGRHADSMEYRRRLVENHPLSPELWIKYGWALRSIGDREQSEAALRRAVELRAANGEAWWNLAELKDLRFTDEEIATIQTQLADPDVAGESRMYLHFTLGKIYGDAKEFDKSFENYARGNAIKRLTLEYDPDWLTRQVKKCRALFTPEVMKARRGWGSAASGPIFIVGMQRAGSTLLEQILASHSQVEAAAELPDITLLAEHIGERIAPDYRSDYPGVLALLDEPTINQFGESYMETTRFRRPLARAFFTDKMPFNFLHIGLIHLALPHAKIIDIRRHPLGCCFSNFSLNFKFGALFAYRLAELGRAYADYIELLAHFDAVLPGRILRVFYEDLVRHPEREIRRVLDHVGLPFEDACLRFHENARTMDSISAVQVRRPLSDNAVDFWRNYDPWLGPLKAALGPVLTAYPDAPPFNF